MHCFVIQVACFSNGLVVKQEFRGMQCLDCLCVVTKYCAQHENLMQIYPLMKTPGPGCLKLTTSLVKVSLKFQTYIKYMYANIFR